MLVEENCVSWIIQYNPNNEIFGMAGFFSRNQNVRYMGTRCTNWDNLVCLRLHIFLSELCLLFNFWTRKFTIMSKSQFGTFIIQKSKNKHKPLKKYTTWDKLSCLSLYIFLLGNNRYGINVSHIETWNIYTNQVAQILLLTNFLGN